MGKHSKRHAQGNRGSSSVKPSLDICILTAGRYDLLEKCLVSVKREIESVPANVYLFNNAGPNDLPPTIDLKWLTYKRINQNRGYPGGANGAIRMGIEPLVLFVSDDIVLQEGCLAHLILTMQDKSIGVCGLKLLFPSDGPADPIRPAGKVQHVGHSVALNGDITHPFVGWSPNHPKTCESRDVFSVTGAVFMVRREAFHKVHGFSEDYGLGYFEDVELCLQIRRLGFRIFLDANAIATHYVGATMQGQAQDAQASLQRNQMMFMRRNQDMLYWDELNRL